MFIICPFYISHLFTDPLNHSSAFSVWNYKKQTKTVVISRFCLLFLFFLSTLLLLDDSNIDVQFFIVQSAQTHRGIKKLNVIVKVLSKIRRGQEKGLGNNRDGEGRRVRAIRRIANKVSSKICKKIFKIKIMGYFFFFASNNNFTKKIYLP